MRNDAGQCPALRVNGARRRAVEGASPYGGGRNVDADQRATKGRPCEKGRGENRRVPALCVVVPDPAVAFPAHGEGGPLAVDEVPAKRIPIPNSELQIPL